MTKIRAVVCRNASYVYHMLSVAKVGYDNDYGRRYAGLHPEDDLSVLLCHADMLTVSGGQHTGKLYGLLVAAPASIGDHPDVMKYYDYLLHIFSETGTMPDSCVDQIRRDIPDRKAFGLSVRNPDITLYGGYEPQIIEICEVMRRNFPVYAEKVWDIEKPILEDYIARVNDILRERDLEQRWEVLTGYSFGESSFYAIICNSLRGGAQAIDISEDKNVFNVAETLGGELLYTLRADVISHEFGIYILKRELHDLINIEGFAHWIPLESLAGYFNHQVLEREPQGWKGDPDMIVFYRRLHKKHPSMRPRDLFIAAVEGYK
ncbi:MAG: hypothetical protein FWE76_08815 [Symbiobacteriaceae bacterium]|nr:hypothetical protein [Symbiobacteriaceae bacterium]